MKVFWLSVFVCGLSLAQIAPGHNSAELNLKKRLSSMKLLPLDRPWPLRLELGAGRPTCSIPLLTFVPKGNFPMPVVKPEAPREPNVSVPAPACDSAR